MISPYLPSFIFIPPFASALRSSSSAASRSIPSLKPLQNLQSLYRRPSPRYPAQLYSPPPPPPPSNNSNNRRNNNDDDGDDNGYPLTFNPLHLYLYYLSKRPLLTKVITTGLIGFLGDILAQFIEKSFTFQNFLKDLNWKRCLSLALISILWTAPLFHYSYNILEHYKPSNLNWHNTLFQVGIDQLILAPVFLVGFLGGLGILENKKWEDGWKWIQRDWGTALKWTWCFFPAFQIWNFAVLKVDARVPAVAIMDLGFNCLISLLVHHSGSGDEEM